MKASELIELLKKEIEASGDNQICVYADLGEDKDGVKRMEAYEDNISVQWAACCNEKAQVLGWKTIINCKKA